MRPPALLASTEVPPAVAVLRAQDWGAQRERVEVVMVATAEPTTTQTNGSPWSDEAMRTAIRSLMRERSWSAHRLARELSVETERIDDWLAGIMAVATLKLKLKALLLESGYARPEPVQVHPGWVLPAGFRLLQERKLKHPPGIVFTKVQGQPALTTALRRALGNPEYVRIAGNNETRQLLITRGERGDECHRVTTPGQISRSVETWAKALGASPGFHAAVQVDGDPSTWMVQF